MGFYDEWEKQINTKNESQFFQSFLNSTPQSLDAFFNYSKDNLMDICKFLVSIPINKFISEINQISVFEAKDVIQYSNLDDAINGVPRVCSFADHDMSFTEIGFGLVHSTTKGACKKYGENHAKVAGELSFIVICNDERKRVVRLTPLGELSLFLDAKFKTELVKRLMLRNCLIKSLIFKAKLNKVYYNDLVSPFLSQSTATRRKPNVKKVLMLILEDSCIKDNIVW